MIGDGFTKLFSSLITSSVWSEDDKTRILWITILAITDADGFCAASVPGLAAMARMELADVSTALARLEGPDPHSRTSSDDGRRLAKVEGGWIVLNYGMYRDRERAEKRKRYMADLMSKRRAEHKASMDKNANKANKMLTPANSSASASASASSSSSVSLEDRVVGEGKPEEPPSVLSYSEKPFDKWTKEDLEASVKDANEDKLLTDDEAVDFVSYWTQKTKRGKYLFWGQKTWSTRRRMKNALELIYGKHRKAPQDAPGYDKWAPENLKDDPLLGEKNPWEMKK